MKKAFRCSFIYFNYHHDFIDNKIHINSKTWHILTSRNFAYHGSCYCLFVRQEAVSAADYSRANKELRELGSSMELIKRLRSIEKVFSKIVTCCMCVSRVANIIELNLITVSWSHYLFSHPDTSFKSHMNIV